MVNVESDFNDKGVDDREGERIEYSNVSLLVWSAQ